MHGNELVPGKVFPEHHTCYIPWGGREISVKNYEVLCDNNYQWVSATGGNIPAGAIPGSDPNCGRETVYIGRAKHCGTTTIGKVVPSHGVCYIPYGGKEISSSEYEILVSRHQNASHPAFKYVSPPEKWIPGKHGSIPHGSFVGGRDHDCVVYVGRAHHSNDLIPGRVNPSHRVCYIPFRGEEIRKLNYEVVPSHGVCYIPYGGKEISSSEYEILVSRHQNASHPAFKYVSPPEKWIPGKHGSIPHGSFVGGRDHDCVVYVGRAHHSNDLIPGRVNPSHRVCYIPFRGEEIRKLNYEVLTGSNMQWIPNEGGNIPHGAVRGGRTSSGEDLYIGRAEHNGTIANGKVHPSHRVCYISYGGKELRFASYEILVSRSACNTGIYEHSSEKATIPSVNWVECADGDVSSAIQEGNDNGDPLYVGRAYYNNELLPGKVYPKHKACYVSWDGHEHAKNVYQVLCGRNLSWVPSSGGSIPVNAVHGGKTSGGEILFIGRAHHSRTVTIGKVHPSHGACYIPYGGREIACQEYEILVSVN